MAMAVLSTELAEIEGKGPGGIWRHDQCGTHVQAPGKKGDRTPTPEQVRHQNAFSYCRDYAIHHATAEFVMAWSAYANSHPHKNKKGEVCFYTWFTMFMKFNITRVLHGLPIEEFPPGVEPVQP